MRPSLCVFVFSLCCLSSSQCFCHTLSVTRTVDDDAPEQLFNELALTLLQQSTLCPLPQAVQPVHWAHEQVGVEKTPCCCVCCACAYGHASVEKRVPASTWRQLLSLQPAWFILTCHQLVASFNNVNAMPLHTTPHPHMPPLAGPARVPPAACRCAG